MPIQLALGRILNQLNWVLGGIVYQLKLTRPVKESQLDLELQHKEGIAQTQRDLPTALRNGEKDNEIKMGFMGVMPVPGFP